MKRRIKVAQLGLGPIGLECLKAATTKSWATVVGAIDTDSRKIGKDLAELSGVTSLRGLRVLRAMEDLEVKPDLVFHTTVSRFPDAFEQIEPLVRRAINVVSSCEELVFPQLRQPKLSARLDRSCRRYGARVVGTGVNPGFVMDLLPLCLCAVSRDATAIYVERVVNASTRRAPLQKKIGSGMAPAEFKRLLQSGQAGHAGLKESIALIAYALGRPPIEMIETGDAIVARRDIRTQHMAIRKGQTCGLHQHAEARLEGDLKVVLDLKMYLEAEDPHDSIRILGQPPLEVLIPGGVAGDSATVSSLINAAPRLLRAAPGLRLISDLQIA